MLATRKKGVETGAMVIETDLLLLDGRILKILRCSPNFSTASRRFRRRADKSAFPNCEQVELSLVRIPYSPKSAVSPRLSS